MADKQVVSIPGSLPKGGGGVYTESRYGLQLAGTSTRSTTSGVSKLVMLLHEKCIVCSACRNILTSAS